MERFERELKRPVSHILESCSWSCLRIHGGSRGSQRASSVPLCLKSGCLGLVLHFLKSHHSYGLAKNTCHKWRRFLSRSRTDSLPSAGSTRIRTIYVIGDNQKIWVETSRLGLGWPTNSLVHFSFLSNNWCVNSDYKDNIVSIIFYSYDMY